MRRRLLALAVLVLLSAGSPRADVAPFPSWRLAANGTITRAIQAGSAIYVAGSFTRIGKAVPTFSATLDPVTLNFVPRTGCAQQDGGTLLAGYHSRPTGVLSDGVGAFPLPVGTALVRVGADCRFDRRFKVVLPPGATPGGFAPEPFDAGGMVYIYVAYSSGDPLQQGGQYVVEADGVTGAIRRFWPERRLSSFAVEVAGATADGRLIGLSESPGATNVGVFDPGTQQLQVAASLSGAWRLVHAGAVVVMARQDGSDSVLKALDGVSLLPLAQWPVVRVSGLGPIVIASGNGRAFIAGQQVTIDGAAATSITAFDATSGAHAASWNAPSWTNDARSRINALHVAGGRLLVFGEFMPGAPRDTAAAFDVGTGALDPWTLPYAVPTPSVAGGQLYFNYVQERDRVARTALAAIDAATGDVLPWTAQIADTRVSSLAIDEGAGHLYAGVVGRVHRIALATGQVDPTWALELDHANQGVKDVSDVAIANGTVYVVGGFDRARPAGSATWDVREGGAAITTRGALTAWQPQVRGTCVIATRPAGQIKYPCVSGVLPVAGRLVLFGSIMRLQAPSEPVRSAMSVAADTGAVDGFLPLVPSGVMGNATTDGTALFVVANLPGLTLARIDEVNGTRVIGPINTTPLRFTAGLALHDGRIYADVERDQATGSSTPNPKTWGQPVGVTSGVIDITLTNLGLATYGLAFHADIAGVAPRPPVNLSASLETNTVRLQWSPGAGDLAALVSPPVPGGTAAISHIVLASLTPGGPPAAQIDTASADTSFSIAAPTGTFYVRVQAKNAFGTSAPSAEVRVDVQPQAPNPPLATIASVSGGVVHIEWQAPPLGWAATSYRLEAGTAAGLANIGTLPVNGLSFDAPVPAGRYYVRIRAVNANGASVPGDEVVIDVP
ncbi:MAG: fibronectin type III domain-containing protein [Vicinamibacterales bacterium]